MISLPDGDLMLFLYLCCCIRRFILFETLGDKRHDQDRDKVPITSADVAGILIEAKATDILSGIRQFSSEQSDGP